MATNSDTDQLPLKGVVLCCTSLAQDARTKLAEVATQMGAVHKLDLTSDVTHLLVGNIDTPKYKYVAKDRPDIRVLNPKFIEAAREAWMTADDFDVRALEDEYMLPCFWGLEVCFTGFDDQDQRSQMAETIKAHGGVYNGDLTKSVTHLIVARPEGKKYEFGKQWGIKLVGLNWYEDSLARGMCVDEALYMPELPRDKQGIGAFRTEPKATTLAKRARDAEPNAAGEESGRRKIRKVASMRLDGQSQELWQNIASNEVQVETTELDAWNDESQTLMDSVSSRPKETTETTEPAKPADTERPNSRQGLFSGNYVLIHGFDAIRAKKLRSFLEPNGATIVQSEDELEAASENLFFQARCLLVPHSAPVETPSIPAGTIVVTEWWVERCIHYKQNLDPAVDSLSTPLMNSQVSGFSELRISTTGFTGVDLRQTAEAVKLMGAAYQEKLLPTTSLLLSANGTVKKEKAYYANKYRIPVLSAAWLWESLRLKKKASIESFRVELPAFDPTEVIGEPSTSCPAPSASLQLRGSGKEVRRKDDFAQPQRLSNTRRRHATPSLMLKASRPATAEAPRKPMPTRTGPFIEEDDENDEPAILADDPAAPEQVSHVNPQASERTSQPLREISPNRSQPRVTPVSQEDAHVKPPDAKATIKAARNDENPAPISPRKSPRRSPKKDNSAKHQQPPLANRQLPSDMANILRRAASTTSEPTEPQKRKNRPLGRNFGTISNHSASPALLLEIPESMDPADGFHFSSHGESEAPQGTQLGYEAPDADAHRRKMNEKMGTTLPEEVQKAKSIGTVKDSSEIQAKKAKNASVARGKGARRKMIT